MAERALVGGFNQAMSLVGLMSQSRVSTFAYGFDAYDREDDEALVAAWKALALRSDASR